MMRTKVCIVLVTIFIAQVLMSCCDCPSSSVAYENIYTDVSITAYDISGFNPEIATDTVYKNAFGLGVYVNFESKRYTTHAHSISGFGFSSAMAFSCDCIEPEYLYTDSITYINIYVYDLQKEQKIDVTDCFQIYSYDGNYISLDEFFKQRESWHDGFQIELARYDIIPNSVFFIAEVFLESGKSFSNQTEVVNFFEE